MQRSGQSILQIVTDANRRGAQVFATDLEIGLRTEGFNVETVALHSGQHRNSLDIDVLGKGHRSVSTLRALRRRAKDHDVVIAHGSNTLFACAVGLIGLNVPVVYRQISDPLFWASSAVRRIRVATYLRATQRVVALSAPIAETFVAHYRLNANDVVVVPNAVPAGAFSLGDEAAASKARHRFGLPAGTFVVGYVGALVTEKGVDVAIDAMAHLPSSHLLVVGDGSERAALERRAHDVAPGRVTFAGQVDDSVSALHAVDVLAMPSRGGDSMPAVLIEAGLCGLPAIATPIGAIPDVVLDGESGSIIASSDVDLLSAGLRDLAADPDLRRRFGRRAIDHCSANYTIEVVAQAWARVLDEAITSTTRTTRSSRWSRHQG